MMISKFNLNSELISQLVNREGGYKGGGGCMC